jgi:hypothetical protein
MAHTDLGDSDAEPTAYGQDSAGEQLNHTKIMLVVTAIASVIIIVVAALFMSLF